MLATLTVAGGVGFAQTPETIGAERARIAAERNQADARFNAEEKACYGKFAVADCQNEAKARRREALADLRRQEVSLNDAERKRKGAARLQAIEERNSPEKQQEAAAQRAKALAEQKEREARAAEKAAERKAAEAVRAGKPEQPRAPAAKKPTRDQASTAESRQRHQDRLKQAQERKARLEKRQANRDKPASKPLPVPP